VVSEAGLEPARP